MDRNKYLDYEILSTVNSSLTISTDVITNLELSRSSSSNPSGVNINIYQLEGSDISEQGTCEKTGTSSSIKTSLSSILNKYFIEGSPYSTTITPETVIYYIPSDATLTKGTVGSYYTWCASKAHKVTITHKYHTIRSFLGQQQFNVKMYSYVGTGTWGPDNHTILPLGHCAKFLFFINSDATLKHIHGYFNNSGKGAMIYIPLMHKYDTTDVFTSNSTNSGYNKTYITPDNEYLHLWEYSTYSSSSDPASYQLNKVNTIYRYGVISY